MTFNEGMRGRLFYFVVCFLTVKELRSKEMEGQPLTSRKGTIKNHMPVIFQYEILDPTIFLCEQLLIHFNRLTSKILFVLIKTVFEILSGLHRETNLVNKCHREDFPA